MRTRRSAGAGEGDLCPTLKLVMEKGPLSGQTHAYGPGTRVRLGRIARGNALAIKDAGVSSKHLLIEGAPASELGRHHWTVTDLESSNGTFLNGEQLKPFAPEVLSDGDIIKIGEQTSIRVELEVGGDESKASGRNLRRNARRGKAAVGELGVIDEDTELGLGEKHLKDEIDLGAELVDEKFEEVAVEIEGKKPRRRGRPKKEVPVEVPEKKGQSSPKDEINDEEKDEQEAAVNDLNFERKGAAESTSTSGVKEGKPGGGIKNVVLDLDKMTMGDWFDYLEVCLPQQIMDATEEAIAEMRQKAERLHEFIQQQRKGKGKVK